MRLICVIGSSQKDSLGRNSRLDAAPASHLSGHARMECRHGKVHRVDDNDVIDYGEALDKYW